MIHRLLITTIFIILFSLKVTADTWSFGSENDYFFESDDRYTGGFYLSWMGDTDRSQKEKLRNSYAAFLNALISWSSLMDDKPAKEAVAIGIHEIIITPKDYTQYQPIYDDIPYVGIFLSEFSLFHYDTEAFKEFSVSLGILGPSSHADELQLLVHRIVPREDPNGWEHQLGDYPVIQARYLNGKRDYDRALASGLHLQTFHNYSVNLGNFYIGAGGGAFIRLGRNMPDNFVAISDIFNTTKSPQLNLDDRNPQQGWSVNAGLFVNIPAFSYMHKEAENLGYDYEKSNSVVMGQIGANYYWNGIQFSVEVYPLGSIYKHYKKDSWGRVYLTWLTH